jgi:hypothetical protein
MRKVFNAISAIVIVSAWVNADSLSAASQTGGENHLKSVNEVDWINGGGSLPHPAGGNNGDGYSEPNPGHYHQGGSENNEGNGGGHPDQPKPDGTPYSGHPHVVWNGDGSVRPADGYGWENSNSPAASNYRVVPLPQGTPYPGYPNVVWNGDGKHIRAADGYRFENQKDPAANNYRVVPLTTEEKIVEIFSGTLRAFKDQGLRDWIIKNVKFKMCNDIGRQHQLSPWVDDGNLVFTEDFLTETKTTQENLIAFESGKLFFTIMKDKSVKDGKTLEMWFMDFSGQHTPVISNMRWAKSKEQNEDFPAVGDLIDHESQFGYIFRAQALQLNKPEDKKMRHEWDKIIHEFKKYVNPLLRVR